MKLILKYKDKIVSFGLLPTIITLVGLHFFPATAVLGVGLIISLTALFYNIFRLKELNFFLLQGTISIGICYYLRLFTGYEYIPKMGITPTLEFMLLIFAFIHVTAPEIYQSFLRRLRLNPCFSYMLEAKIIVVLSALHLFIIGIMKHGQYQLSPEKEFVLINVVPSGIYIFCLIINIIGIHIAVKNDPFRYKVLRIAPVFQEKVYLIPKPTQTPDKMIWDLPVESLFDGSVRKAEAKAYRLAHNYLNTRKRLHIHPRFLSQYRTGSPGCHCSQNIRLYILPLTQEYAASCHEGRFVSFEEISAHPEQFSKNLQKELDTLQMAAEIWNKYELN